MKQHVQKIFLNIQGAENAGVAKQLCMFPSQQTSSVESFFEELARRRISSYFDRKTARATKRQEVEFCAQLGVYMP